jgi:hypothetical protein
VLPAAVATISPSPMNMAMRSTPSIDRRRLAEWAEERVTATSSKTRSTELEVLVDRVEEHAVAGEDTELHAMAPRLLLRRTRTCPQSPPHPGTPTWPARGMEDPSDYAGRLTRSEPVAS